jgi:hypothetical protein
MGVRIVSRPSRPRSDGTPGAPSRADADRLVLCGGAECALWDGNHWALTVEEAADRLQIGRTLAYQETQLYLQTGGCDGIPALKIGGCVRVPVPGLLILAFTGRVVSTGELEELLNDLLGRPHHPPAVPGVADDEHSAELKSAGRVRRSSGRRRADSVEQLRLLPGE